MVNYVKVEFRSNDWKTEEFRLPSENVLSLSIQYALQWLTVGDNLKDEVFFSTVVYGRGRSEALPRSSPFFLL